MTITLPLTLTLALSASLPSASDTRGDYAHILKTYVEDGRVDYKGLAKNDLDRLDRFLERVAKADLPTDRGLRIGFYIDAYNALVLRSVITHGRPRSVLDVEGFFKDRVHTVAGKKVSLDQLEKEMLNPYAKDPRTHFVLVCAAVGCPILEAKPYVGDDVDRRMEVATRRYLRSPSGAQVGDRSVRLSKIFDWYAGDFGGPDGVKAFALRYLSPSDRSRAGTDPTVAFLDYNWTLNQQ